MSIAENRQLSHCGLLILLLILFLLFLVFVSFRDCAALFFSALSELTLKDYPLHLLYLSLSLSLLFPFHSTNQRRRKKMWDGEVIQWRVNGPFPIEWSLKLGCGGGWFCVPCTLCLIWLDVVVLQCTVCSQWCSLQCPFWWLLGSDQLVQ